MSWEPCSKMKSKHKDNWLYQKLRKVGFPEWFLDIVYSKAQQIFRKSLDQIDQKEFDTVILHSLIVAATYGNAAEREAETYARLLQLALKKILWK